MHINTFDDPGVGEMKSGTYRVNIHIILDLIGLIYTHIKCNVIIPDYAMIIDNLKHIKRFEK